MASSRRPVRSRISPHSISTTPRTDFGATGPSPGDLLLGVRRLAQVEEGDGELGPAQHLLVVQAMAHTRLHAPAEAGDGVPDASDLLEGESGGQPPGGLDARVLAVGHELRHPEEDARRVPVATLGQAPDLVEHGRR